MLNPATDKFKVEIFDMFPEELTKKYDTFLFQKNGAIKTIHGLLIESLQSVSIPGFALQTTTVDGLQNLGKNPDIKNFPTPTHKITYSGNAPQSDIIEGNNVSLTCRNYIINWMYIFEILFKYYKRTREVPQFKIMLTMMDAAEIPMMNFIFSGCFVAQLPGLEFSFNSSFRESKTFDVGFAFNQMDVDFLIPGFDVETFNL